MTPKKKAKELVLKYQFHVTTWDCYNDEPLELKQRMPHMKECALIAVDELIIQNGELYLNGLKGVYYTKKNNFLFELKQEIEKL